MRRRGRRVGPQVDDDGSGGVEPLQGALRAAEVDLLHVSAVRLVAQAAAGRRQGLKTTALLFFQVHMWNRFKDIAVVTETSSAAAVCQQISHPGQMWPHLSLMCV